MVWETLSQHWAEPQVLSAPGVILGHKNWGANPVKVEGVTSNQVITQFQLQLGIVCSLSYLYVVTTPVFLFLLHSRGVCDTELARWLGADWGEEEREVAAFPTLTSHNGKKLTLPSRARMRQRAALGES